MLGTPGIQSGSKQFSAFCGFYSLLISLCSFEWCVIFNYILDTFFHEFWCYLTFPLGPFIIFQKQFVFNHLTHQNQKGKSYPCSLLKFTWRISANKEKEVIKEEILYFRGQFISSSLYYVSLNLVTWLFCKIVLVPLQGIYLKLYLNMDKNVWTIFCVSFILFDKILEQTKYPILMKKKHNMKPCIVIEIYIATLMM